MGKPRTAGRHHEVAVALDAAEARGPGGSVENWPWVMAMVAAAVGVRLLEGLQGTCPQAGTTCTGRPRGLQGEVTAPGNGCR